MSRRHRIEDPLAVLLRQFVREHATWLHKLAARLVGGNSAEDVAQDAFVSLICWTRSNPPQVVIGLLGSSDQTKRLLYTITARRAYDHIRRRQRRSEDLAGDGSEIERDTARKSIAHARVDDQIDRVERAYAMLSPMQRIAHVLHHYYGFNHAEVAAILEISEANSKTLVHRANRALKCAMEMKQ